MSTENPTTSALDAATALQPSPPIQPARRAYEPSAPFPAYPVEPPEYGRVPQTAAEPTGKRVHPVLFVIGIVLIVIGALLALTSLKTFGSGLDSLVNTVERVGFVIGYFLPLIVGVIFLIVGLKRR
jgi:uncharacterized membrane protein YtjA (UPF0391 family)